MVALTGIEPEGWQFSSLQLGLSGCVFSAAGIPGCSETPLRTADVTAQSQRSRGPRARTGRCRRFGNFPSLARAPESPETEPCLWILEPWLRFSFLSRSGAEQRLSTDSA